MLGFRVWDVNKNKFASSGEFWIGEHGILFKDNAYNMPTVPWGDEKYIPLQSTGLTDMEHEMIFEGDILWASKLDGLYLVESIPKFYEDIFSYGGILELREIRILGNRFETPELLEEIK